MTGAGSGKQRPILVADIAPIRVEQRPHNTLPRQANERLALLTQQAITHLLIANTWVQDFVGGSFAGGVGSTYSSYELEAGGYKLEA